MTAIWRREEDRLGTRAKSQLSGVEIAVRELTATNFHHVIPKKLLRDAGLFDRVWDPRNGMLLTEDEHVGHEDGSARIPRSKIPEEAWTFARELGDPWIAVLESRRYPNPDPKEGQ